MGQRLYGMPFRAEPLIVSEDEHEELQRMSLSRSLPAGDVFRARLILMLLEGRSYAEIQQRLQTTAPTISKWRKRFVERRMDGLLQERHPGQKPSVITPQLEAKVLAATRRKPSDGSTHWSSISGARQPRSSVYIESSTTCSGVLRGREISHSSARPVGSGVADVARPCRTPWL